MKTIADMLREEGKKEGKEEGRRRGIAETLLTLLSHKIGQLPEDTQTQIHQLNEQPFSAKTRRRCNFAPAFVCRNSAHGYLCRFNGSVLESMILRGIVTFR